MKTITTELKNHLLNEVTSLAWLVKIIRKDNVIKAYTTHDQNIVYAGLTYKADGAFSPSEIESSLSLAVDNLEVQGLISNDDISEGDLLSGLYDNAFIEISIVNWANLSDGHLVVKTGNIGEITINEQGFYIAEMRALQDKLQHTVGRWVSPECDAELGDSRCKVNLNAWKITSSVQTTDGSSTFFSSDALAQGTRWSSYGLVKFLTGQNAGYTYDVKIQIGGNVFLWIPANYEIAVGDTFELTAGCDKRLTTCRTKFNNILNFRGFPKVPGIDKLMDYPNAKQG